VSDDLDAFKAKIQLMREMGVTEADGIKLGPPVAPPPKEETKEQYLARIAAQQRRHHDIMFAASGTKPKLAVLK
jgi:hypothetical protein